MGCCSGVVTQAYDQPNNPVLSRGKDSLAILTVAPFRGVPQPEAHGRIKPYSETSFAVRFRVVCLLFNHVRRGGSCYSPTTRNLYNPDTPTTKRVKMLSGITSSITAIKVSIDLLQVILDAKSQSEREKAVYEMRRQLADLQIQNAELAKTLALQYEEILLLKQKCHEIDERNRKLECYTIHKTGFGHFVYAFRNSLDEEDTCFHYACPNCYQHGVIAILQPVEIGEHDKFHISKCLKCDSHFKFERNDDYIPPPSVEEIGRALSSNP
ncbi:hypothetical protein P2R98_15805 [Escherichia coli]